MLRSIVTHPRKLSPCRHYNISCQLLSPWRFFCIRDQTIPLEPFLENINKVTKHVDGFFAENIEHISKHVDWFFVKNIEHIAKHGWMDLLPDLRIARSTTPAGGRQGQERSRKNRGGNNNQHLRKVFMIHLFWKDTFEDDRRIPKQNNGCWHLQSLPMGGAAWHWEGTKFEQEFTWSVQVDRMFEWSFLLHVGLICYEAKIHVKKSMIGI